MALRDLHVTLLQVNLDLVNLLVLLHVAILGHRFVQLEAPLLLVVVAVVAVIAVVVAVVAAVIAVVAIVAAVTAVVIGDGVVVGDEVVVNVVSVVGVDGLRMEAVGVVDVPGDVVAIVVVVVIAVVAETVEIVGVEVVVGGGEIGGSCGKALLHSKHHFALTLQKFDHLLHLASLVLA